MLVTKHPLSLALLLFAAPAFSQTSPPSPLPIRQVTVFTSGVSYIERDGSVNGDATVPLTFRTAQINDLLKSLTLTDSQGQVQPVIYGARDPIGRTLQSFAIDVTTPQSRAELLNQLRGSSVSVTTVTKTTETGQIISVESKSVTGPNNTTTTVDTLNLLGADGLRSVRLDDVLGIKLLDARLDQEFRAALTTLASGADNQRRSVTLHFTGSGKREVSVGYITESPLWKISYRLLLDMPKTSYIQGWALVENTSDDDWSNIHLSLVSGRPISFIEDLYQPLYLPRPVVQPDIVASPTPQTHDDNMQADAPVSAMAPAPPAAAPALPIDQGVSGAIVNEQHRFKARGEANIIGEADASRATNSGSTYFDAVNSVTAQANGTDAGEQFAYNITTPVTLPRQQAAMIPVIAQNISADKVSLYNADSDPRYPLNAVRLKNNTALHLKGGPVTLFDGGTYAGDATMEDVPPGDTRLISYAVDLSIVGERQQLGTNQIRTTLAIHSGVLTITVHTRTETKYNFKSKSPTDKTVLVEHPFDADAKLVTPPAAAERTSDLYRFAVPVSAGKTASLDVVTEKPISSTIALLDGDINSFAYYAEAKDIPAATRTALEDVARQRRHIQNLLEQAGSDEIQVTQFAAEQDRIRKNMAALDHASPLYKRYVGELEHQETQITNLRADALQQRNAADAARTALRNTLDTLDISG
ncbi:MAG: hypothetical protein ACRYFS_23325 [Janthinobacterium lividum]